MVQKLEPNLKRKLVNFTNSQGLKYVGFLEIKILTIERILVNSPKIWYKFGHNLTRTNSRQKFEHNLEKNVFFFCFLFSGPKIQILCSINSTTVNLQPPFLVARPHKEIKKTLWRLRRKKAIFKGWFIIATMTGLNAASPNLMTWRKRVVFFSVSLG